MGSVREKVSVRTVGANGQISLGKRYAGRQVLVEEDEEGVWKIRTARVIPDNEAWLHTPQAQRDLAEAIEWANSHPVDTSNTAEILARAMDD